MIVERSINLLIQFSTRSFLLICFDDGYSDLNFLYCVSTPLLQYIMDSLLIVLVVSFYSIRLTILFRRTFDVAGNRLFHVINSAWLVLYALLRMISNFYPTTDTEWMIHTVYRWLLLLCILYGLIIDMVSHEKRLKSFIIFVSLYVSISEFVSIASLCWISTCGIATSQLLRWPPSLKARLRKMRTILGPSYAILITGAWYKEQQCYFIENHRTIDVAAPGTIIIPPSLLTVAFLSSITASVLFRPDNNSIWMMFPSIYNTTRATTITSLHHHRITMTKKHKFMHAMMMVLSYVCMIIKCIRTDYNFGLRCIGFLLIGISWIGFIVGTDTAIQLYSLICMK